MTVHFVNVSVHELPIIPLGNFSLGSRRALRGNDIEVCFSSVGKGPQKAYYENLIAKKNFTKVSICTVWLSSEDYPIMLGKWAIWGLVSGPLWGLGKWAIKGTG
jgi:glycosyltransferase involved in cell wall biosynthesis